MREDMNALSWSIIIYSSMQYLVITYSISASPIPLIWPDVWELLSGSLSIHQLYTVCICDLCMI